MSNNNSQKSQIICPICKKSYTSSPYLNICCHSTACFYCLTKQSQQVSLKTPLSLTRRNKTPPLPSSSTTSEIQNYSIHSRTLGGSSVLQPFAHSFLSKEADGNLQIQNHSPRQEVIGGLNSEYYQQNFQQQYYCPFCHRTGQKVKFVENVILKKVLESRGIHLKPISKVLLQKYSYRLLKPQCNDESQLSVSQTNPLESSSLFKEYVNESLSVTRIQQVMLCQRCGESKSEWKCKDCGNILLCGVCSKLLHSLGVYAKHNLEQFIPQPTTTTGQNTIKGNQQSSPSKLLKASSSKIKCQKHSDRFAAYFDMNTWQALCNDCMREARSSEDNSQHNIVGIQVALCKTLHDIRKKQKHITNKIIQRNDYKKGINNLIQNTELKYEEMNRKIRKGFDQLKNALQIKQNEILHDLHDCKIMSKGVLKEKSTQNQWSLDKLNLLNQVVMKGLNNPQFLFLYGVQYIMREIESFTARQKININTTDDPIKAIIQTSLCVKDENAVQQQAMSLPQIDYPITPNFQQMSKYISQLNVAMPQKKLQVDIQNDESSPFFRDLKQKELINVVGGSDISPACTYLQSQADDVGGGHNSARPSTYNTDQSSIQSEQRQDPKMYRKFNRSTGFKREMQSDHYGGMSNNKSRKPKDYKNTLIPRVATLASSSGKRMASSTDNLHQSHTARTSTSSSNLASANKKIYNHERNGSQRLQPPTKNFQKQRSSLSHLNTPSGQVIKRKANNKFNSSDSPKNAQKSSPLKKQHLEVPQTSRFTTTGKSIIELRKVESQSNLNRPSSCTNSNSSKFIFSGSSGGNKLRNHLRKNFIKTENRESLMISGAISQISSTPRDHSGLRDSKKKKGSRYSGWINSRNNTNQIQPDSSSTNDQLSPKNLRVYSKDSKRYDRQRMSEHKEIGLGGYSEMLDLDDQIANRNNQVYTNTAASNYYLQQSYSSLLNNDRIKHQQQDLAQDDKSSSQVSKKKPNHKFRLTTPKSANQKLPTTTSTMAQTDRDNSLYSSIQPLSISQLAHTEDNKAIDPLFKREFNIASKTSTSIQVGWTHFKNIQLPQGVQLLYHLDYVVVSKSGNVQPFRKIYKGRSFRCIITDLMPRTEYKFRVAPIMVELDGNEVKGPWSDPVLTVKTQDLQKVKQSTLHPHASVRSNKNGQLINFTRPGIIHTQNPYTFGRQYWAVNIMPCVSFAYKSCDELNGSMIVGVIAKNQQNSKMIGTTINYSSLKGSTQVKLFLNAQSNCLTIFTQQEKSDNGEKFINLPSGYQFYPALQNKTVVQQPQASLTTQFIYDIKPEGFIN